MILGWTEGTVTPEAGQTTTIYIYGEDGVTLINTITGLTGTSYDIPRAAFGDAPIALVRVGSSRTDDEGTFDSLQAHGIWVQLSPISSGALSAAGFGAFSAGGAAPAASAGSLAATGTGSFSGTGANGSATLTWFPSSLQAVGVTSTGWNGYTVRTLVPAALITHAGTKIRIGLTSSGENFTLEKMYVGVKGAGDFDFASAPTQVTWGGGSAGALIAGSALSDEVNFTRGDGQSLVVAFRCTPGASAADNLARAIGTTDGAATAYKFADDCTSLTASGYTFYGGWTMLEDLDIGALV